MLLKEGNNHFSVKTFDNKGNYLECSPNEFTIRYVVEGAMGTGQGATLPFHYGLEIKNKKTDRMEFIPIKGLEKDRELTSTGLVGVSLNRTTSSQIRPGMKQDFLRVPIYEGSYYANGSRAIYNEHVFDLVITGEDLPALLPENSTFDLTIKLDRNGSISGKANFHKLDYQHEFTVDKEYRQPIPAIYKIESEFKDGFKIIREIEYAKVLSDNTKLLELKNTLTELQIYFEKGKSDNDRRKEVFDKMREILIKVDELHKGKSWDILKKEIKSEFEKTEKESEEIGSDEEKEELSSLWKDVDSVIKLKDEDLGRELLEKIEELFFRITLIYQLIGRIKHWNESFNEIKWTDSNKARQILNAAIQTLNTNPSKETLLPFVISLNDLLPEGNCNGCGKKLTQCVCVS